jgi:hypothetical protein
MIFAANDASSLAASLERWEYVEYAACALVAIGCAGEYVAEFTNWCTSGIKESKDRLAKRSTLLLIASLALELVCLVKTSSLSGRLIGSLSDKATNANTKADSALGNSSIAESRSEATSIVASKALDKSNEAAEAAAKVKDKVEAVDKRAEEIDSDLARTQYLLSGRSVTNPDSLVKQLKQYKGQTVHFGSYNSEPDESLLCGELASAARAAEMNVPEDFCGRLMQVGHLSTGIVISGPDIPQTLALAQIILHTSNLGPGGAVSGIKAPELNILIGAKPRFEMGQARGVKVKAKKAKENSDSDKR